MIRINQNNKIVYPELSYIFTGICFAVHNELGRFAREKQYVDALESRLQDAKINCIRECPIGDTGNRVDLLIEDKIIVEVKAKPLILKEDFYQLQRYLQAASKKLGLLINFRNRYLKPIRVIRIDTDARSRFV